MSRYLKATGREEVAALADGIKEHLALTLKYMPIRKNILTK